MTSRHVLTVTALVRVRALSEKPYPLPVTVTDLARHCVELDS